MTDSVLSERLAEGRPLVGGWCSMGSWLAAEVLADAGFDYVAVDGQHGLGGPDAAGPMLASIGRAGAAPVVRVPGNDPAAIGRALDLGAEAVIVPLVESAEAAARAVAATRYPPAGVRSYGPTRSSMLLNRGRTPWDVDEQVRCLVMIETMAGVEAAEAICRTPGLAGIYVGPADLSVSLGAVPGRDEPPAVEEAIAQVLAVCEAAGILPGIHTLSGDEAAKRAAQGFRLVTVATDVALLRAAALKGLERARSSDA